MTAPYEKEFSIALEDSMRFARLSGDFNPLHVDPIAARRTPYGGTVVHGIHLVLATLDRSAAEWSAAGMELAGLAVTFNNPVVTGMRVVVRATPSPDGKRVRFAAMADGRAAYSFSLDLRPRETRTPLAIVDREFEVSAPTQLAFPPTFPTEALELRASAALVDALFPALAAASERAWIADMLATTRLVGMRLPGADSIYSTCKLERSAAGAAALRCELTRSDERFRLVRVAVSGAALTGHIEALFRPQPVAQESLARVIEKVARDATQGQRALIVGGSRGLGELVAKIVAAGGGEVTLTYASGRDDAERICGEARALQRRCTARQLDIATLLAEPPEWLAQGNYSHVYFFASPAIAKSVGNRWNATLFDKFAAVYVDAFARLAETILAAAPAGAKPRFFYPSTIFLAQPEKDFVEYCVAKAAGEGLCKQLALRYGTVFYAPRLPRLRTDQTSGVQAGMQDAFPVMRDAVTEFQGLSA